MTQEETKKLQVFEAHFRMLMGKFVQLKAENAELYDMVDQKDAALKELQQKHEELQKQYDNLKLAKIISVSDSDLDNAKKRLAKLVRDVDKCIALLNT
jgi:predicted nuclease with TOPRIM domain